MIQLSQRTESLMVKCWLVRGDISEWRPLYWSHQILHGARGSTSRDNLFAQQLRTGPAMQVAQCSLWLASGMMKWRLLPNVTCPLLGRELTCNHVQGRICLWFRGLTRFLLMQPVTHCQDWEIGSSQTLVRKLHVEADSPSVPVTMGPHSPPPGSWYSVAQGPCTELRGHRGPCSASPGQWLKAPVLLTSEANSTCSDVGRGKALAFFISLMLATT